MRKLRCFSTFRALTLLMQRIIFHGGFGLITMNYFCGDQLRWSNHQRLFKLGLKKQLRWSFHGDQTKTTINFCTSPPYLQSVQWKIVNTEVISWSKKLWVVQSVQWKIVIRLWTKVVIGDVRCTWCWFGVDHHHQRCIKEVGESMYIRSPNTL